MQWIQENIKAFGGDPNQVTISGHSAGSAFTHLHMLSPRSRGLFSKAISLSGTAANYWAGRNTDHARYATEMGEIFDCPTDNSKEMINCLKKIDPVELTRAQWKLHELFLKSPAKLPLSTFSPRMDPEAEVQMLPENPLEMLRNGDFQHLPWMVGLTSQEGAWYSSTIYGQNSMQYLKEFDEKSELAASLIVSGLLDSKEKYQEALNFYTKGK